LGISYDKGLHFGEPYITSFVISTIRQIVKVKLQWAVYVARIKEKCGQNFRKEIGLKVATWKVEMGMGRVQ
jgi:hypothetical protein